MRVKYTDDNGQEQVVDLVVIMGENSSGGMSPMGATTAADGSPATPVVSESTADWRGNYPNTWYLQDSATTEAAEAFYTSGDVSMYNHFEMNLTVLDAGNVTVSVSLDGTTYRDVILFDRSTEALFAAAAITAVGQYYIDGKFYSIKVTSSAASTNTIIYSHSVK